MSLADVPIRAQTLGGQIKQADADVAEARIRLTRAEQTLETAKRELLNKELRAAEVRNELLALRDEASAAIESLGAGPEEEQSAGGENAEPEAGFVEVDKAGLLALAGEITSETGIGRMTPITAADLTEQADSFAPTPTPEAGALINGIPGYTSTAGAFADFGERP